MTFRKSALVCALAGASLLALTNFGAPGPSAPAASAETAEFKPGTRRIVPGPNDGRIAFVAAQLLEQEHYLQHPLDDAFSAKFFERYTETLDYVRRIQANKASLPP